ncbi:MAG: LLM class flavin-dependent oxidoreductase [Dehalococcoidia bacterium]
MASLSVLDQSPIRAGGTAVQALQETLQLAEACDRLGYERYWLSEHHASRGLASAAPEILIGQVAARTRRIRVGSGGVMLMHYAPLKVAEQFRMLEALYPGRIDLGIGRAPGSDRRTAMALATDPMESYDEFPARLEELHGFLADDLPDGHPFHGVRAMPDGVGLPELWMLGSSKAGAEYAARMGWRFAFAHFITPEGGEDVVHAYRDSFQPSPFLDHPVAMLAIGATVAETVEEAERLAYSRWVWRLIRDRATFRGIPSPEDALSIALTDPEKDYIEYARRASIYGPPDEVRHRLEATGREYGTDDFMVVTITYDFAARVRSYELLAREFGLPGAAP